jgi:hypothetical protein
MVPVIGLPVMAKAAPALKLWPVQERILETNYKYIIFLGRRIYFASSLPQTVTWSHVGDTKSWNE